MSYTYVHIDECYMYLYILSRMSPDPSHQHSIELCMYVCMYICISNNPNDRKHRKQQQITNLHLANFRKVDPENLAGPHTHDLRRSQHGAFLVDQVRVVGSELIVDTREHQRVRVVVWGAHFIGHNHCPRERERESQRWRMVKSMYVYMYVCKYACMYVCMHACKYACMHVCMHVCKYACMYV
jgi:hypothetical protein